MVLKKKLVFLSVVAMEIGKNQFFTYHGNGCYDQKMLHQKLESYGFKVPLKKWIGWVTARRNKTS